MTSLKGYVPALARLLGTTPGALYERQRALVRAGLLDQSEGRGPGSGVRATAPSVALLLISVLAAENLTNSEVRVAAIADAHPTGGERCPFTERTNFLDALASICVGGFLASRVIELSVSRTADRATVKYRDKYGDEKTSAFVGNDSTEPSVAVAATLSRNTLRAIADDVTAMLNEAFDSVTEHLLPGAEA